MGNSGSRQQRQLEPEQQWAHSFPRNPPRLHQHKVLPERDINKKLRSTNNGEILNSGGTLSGRQHLSSIERKNVHRSNSISSNDYHFENRPKSCPNRSYVPNGRDPLHKSGRRYGNQNYEYKSHYGGLKEKMKTFGSEPDLRQCSARSMYESEDPRDKVRGRKKYKAPPPPANLKISNSSGHWNGNFPIDSESPARRMRLFKTRAEVKKQSSSPVNNPVESNREIVQNKMCTSSHEKPVDAKYNRLSLPEMHKIENEFQSELKEATKRFRSTKVIDDRAEETNLRHSERKTKEKLKTLDHNINNKENIMYKLKQIEQEKLEEEKQFPIPCNDSRGQPSGKESTPEQSPPRSSQKNKTEKDTAKLFYFGMDEPIYNLNQDQYMDNLLNNFASSIQMHQCVLPLVNSSGSDISTELDLDESQVSSSGIALQLRPILPKKQLEIPRFSPAAAWKLLSAVESSIPPSTAASDDGPILIEDRIEKLSRQPPPPAIQGPRSSHDKSGDSGISGDAGLPGLDDTPDVNIPSDIQNLPLRPHGLSWTPQQDLGEDESSVEEDQVFRPTNLSSKPHVFSLSLPRDNHLAAYLEEKTLLSFNGLQRLKRSVSGVLGTLTNKKEQNQKTQNDNWFLSRSAPNSLNNGFNSLEIRHSQKSDDPEQISNFLPVNNVQNVGRVMYLPELDIYQNEKSQIQQRYERSRRKQDRSKSADRSKGANKLSLLSKSCENISIESKGAFEPEDLQDPPENEDKKKISKAKRFAFQSTVRQIERKRLAEKLSKEAEKRERQRLHELEAMRRVEEEFQRKRAREKATIRQQLRLFSMDDSGWTSLPPNLNLEDELQTRSEPDGAVSSSASSPTLPLGKIQSRMENKRSMEEIQKSLDASANSARNFVTSPESSDERMRPSSTQVLSEFRQPQREYKDFRGNASHHWEHNEAQHVKQTTVHPQVICNMPKAVVHQGSTNQENGVNYRKNFAHGVRTNKSVGSSYSEDSQSNTRNHSPRIGEAYINTKAQISRF